MVIPAHKIGALSSRGIPLGIFKQKDSWTTYEAEYPPIVTVLWFPETRP